mgnify:CR=1 FL=1
MNSAIVINKIFLDNYKLFENFTLDFKNGLNIFDGPNGYGKTSIFDAIEFLITGSISRIQESEVIAANLSYSKNCLANDADKDIRIKAEFKDKYDALKKPQSNTSSCAMGFVNVLNMFSILGIAILAFRRRK